MSNEIDLGKPASKDCCSPCVPEKKNGKYYPSLYISGIEGIDMDIGDVTFTCKGRVKRISSEESEKGETNSYDIEIQSISDVSGVEEKEGITAALDKIAKKKTKAKEE